MPNTNERDALIAAERTPQDYAIEHAGYLADAAERFIAAVCIDAQAALDHDEQDVLATAKAADKAREDAGEYMTGLRAAIHEFRVRRNRALAATAPNAGAPLEVPAELSDAVSFLMEMAAQVGDAHENHGRNADQTIAARTKFHAAICAALAAAPAQQAGAAPSDDDLRKVYQDACDHADKLQQGFSYGRAQALRAVFRLGQQAGAPLESQVNAMTRILSAAWAKSEPGHSVTLHPTSYESTFADLARAALAAGAPLPLAPSEAVEDEGECHRCGLTPTEHTMMHWCDNQSFRLATPPQSTLPASEAVKPVFVVILTNRACFHTGSGDPINPVRIRKVLSAHASREHAELAKSELEEKFHEDFPGYRRYGDKPMTQWEIVELPLLATRAQPQADAAPVLHPATSDLVARFARALAEKLAAAEVKYGHSDGWLSPDWTDECRAKLLEHVAKGDPRDVAAYCAFLWHHGASTAAPRADAAEPVAWEVWGPADRAWVRASKATYDATGLRSDFRRRALVPIGAQAPGARGEQA